MEWNVKNAVNRDVERQHLNKILAEIKKAVEKTEQTTTVIRQVQSYSGGGSSAGSGTSSGQRSKITVQLKGDAEGTGTGTSSITIPVSLASDVVREAPLDGQYYWRVSGNWEPIPSSVSMLRYADLNGLAVYDGDAMEWVSVEIVGDDEWTTVVYGNGVEGNPTVLLTDAAKEGYKRITGEAGEDVHSLRAVTIESGIVGHPSLSNTSDAVKIVGIARTAASIGNEVNVQTGGTVTEGSWTWSEGQVFVGDEGVLTQTAPTTGYVVSIGTAVSATTINIRVSLPLIRS